MTKLSDDPERRCSEGLTLRRKLEKLRWLGLESEADQVALKIARLACRLPAAVPSAALSTD